MAGHNCSFVWLWHNGPLNMPVNTCNITVYAVAAEHVGGVSKVVAVLWQGVQ